MLIFLLGMALSLAGEPVHEGATSERPDAAVTEAARDASWIGASCAWSTMTMARRVMDDGVPWTVQGTLAAYEGQTGSVATPFVLGEEGARVLATERLETLVKTHAVGTPLTFEGRRLDVDGKVFVVLLQADALAQ